MSWEINLGNALDEIKKMPEDSVDLVITDPPYDTLEKWRDMGTTTRLKDSSASSNEWFPTLSIEELKEVFVEIYRVLKNNTHLYVLCDEETADNIKPILREIGFKLRKSLIWHKVGRKKEVACPNCGSHVLEMHSPGTPGMGYPYRSQYEMVVLAEKGKRKPPKNKSVRNVLPVPWIKSKSTKPKMLHWIKTTMTLVPQNLLLQTRKKL